jgi:transposase-like protein
MNSQSSGRRTLDEVREIIGEYRTSGQTQSEFALRRGIGLSTLAFWLRREKEQGEAWAPGCSQEANFVEVSLPDLGAGGKGTPGAFEIEFAGGERLI